MICDDMFIVWCIYTINVDGRTRLTLKQLSFMLIKVSTKKNKNNLKKMTITKENVTTVSTFFLCFVYNKKIKHKKIF